MWECRRVRSELREVKPSASGSRACSPRSISGKSQYQQHERNHTQQILTSYTLHSRGTNSAVHASIPPRRASHIPNSRPTACDESRCRSFVRETFCLSETPRCSDACVSARLTAHEVPSRFSSLRPAPHSSYFGHRKMGCDDQERTPDSFQPACFRASSPPN